MGRRRSTASQAALFQWMSEFGAEFEKRMGFPPTRLDWQNAEYLHDQGLSPSEAAAKASTAKRRTGESSNALEELRSRVREAKRIPTRHEDATVRNPDLLPTALANRYERSLKSQLGRGWKVVVVDSKTGMPRSWDHSNTTQLNLTSPRKEEIPVTFHVNFAHDESSGNVTIDVPGWGGTVGVARSNTPDKAIDALISELVTYLRSF